MVVTVSIFHCRLVFSWQGRLRYSWALSGYVTRQYKLSPYWKTQTDWISLALATKLYIGLLEQDHHNPNPESGLKLRATAPVGMDTGRGASMTTRFCWKSLLWFSCFVFLDITAKESGTIKFMPTQNIDNKTGRINGNEKVCQIFEGVSNFWLCRKCSRKSSWLYFFSIQVNLPNSLIGEFLWPALLGAGFSIRMLLCG